MSFLAWLIYFLLMPMWAFTTLYFKLFFTAIYKVLKLTVKTVLLILKLVKMGIQYIIIKIMERKQRRQQRRLLNGLLMVIMLSSLAAPAMAADPIEALKEGVSGGIQDFFVSAADSIYEWGITENTTESEEVREEYGAGPAAVFKIAANEHDPYESKTVQDMRKRTAVIGIFVFLIYVFYGASCVNLSCSGLGWIDRAQYIVSETPFDEYRKILIRTFISILCIHYILKLIIKFNAAAVFQIMYSVLDSIGLTQDHWVMYCCMAGCYGFEMVFYAIRRLLMDVIAGSDILIGSLYSFACTREFSVETVKYFGRITLLQFIIVLLTTFGISIIDESSQAFQPVEYLALMIILFVVSGIIVFGFSKLFKTAKVTTKVLMRGH